MLNPLSPVWFEENYWRNDDFAECAARCDSVLMQFTGLKDKNGVEIFEGEIVKYQYHGGIVIDTIECFGTFFGVQRYTGILDTFDPIEVIGNIYQNPELLK